MLAILRSTSLILDFFRSAILFFAILVTGFIWRIVVFLMLITEEISTTKKLALKLFLIPFYYFIVF